MPDKDDEFTMRRKARQKKIRKRRRRRILITLLILAVVTFAVLSVTVLFPIKTVNTTGSKIYSAEEILNNVKLTKSNIFTVSESKVETELRKKLPFIDKVKFKRKLPDTLILLVTDAKEYEYYTKEEKYYTVSKNGYVLAEYTEPPQNLVEIKCGEAVFKTGEKVDIKNPTESELKEKLVKLTADKSFNLNSVDVSNIANLSVTVEGRFNVKLGTDTYLENKISHLKSMVQNIEENRKGDIDLSMWTPTKSEGSFTAN